MSVPAGPVNLSASAQLVAPAVVVKGTLSITASELYFEVDEDEPSFKAIDPKVRDSSISKCVRLVLPAVLTFLCLKVTLTDLFLQVFFFFFLIGNKMLCYVT